MYCASVFVPKKPLPNIKSQRFSSTSFRVSDFTFRSLIHFWLMFVHSGRYGLKFLFMYRHLNAQAPFVKNMALSLLSCLCTFVKSYLSIHVCIYFCFPYSVPLMYLFISASESHSLNYCSFRTSLER